MSQKQGSNQPSSKVPYPKKTTTYAQQVNQLQDRGLIITNKQQAEATLEQINYYRFSGYCLPFEQDHSSHQFQPNTHFTDITNLYTFDRELRCYLTTKIDSTYKWKERLIALIKQHLIDTHKMGFPDDWQSRPVWASP